jgi:hypothetical protein
MQQAEVLDQKCHSPVSTGCEELVRCWLKQYHDRQYNVGLIAVLPVAVCALEGSPAASLYAPAAPDTQIDTDQLGMPLNIRRRRQNS